jgi:hypothetical protein
MKKSILISAAFLWSFISAAISPTSFTFQFYDANGQPDTNYTTMQGWPPASGGVTVVSNVIVWAGGNQIITNQFQGTNTLGTNSAMPNTYKVFCPATGLGFFATIPQTTNQLPLATYATGLPVTYQSSSLFFYITNALGGNPTLASYSSVVSALGFVPATNAAALSYSQLPFTPPTNSFSGLAFALGFNPATNNPATNTSVFLTSVSAITNASGVATNVLLTFGTNILNYQHQ